MHSWNLYLHSNIRLDILQLIINPFHYDNCFKVLKLINIDKYMQITLSPVVSNNIPCIPCLDLKTKYFFGSSELSIKFSTNFNILFSNNKHLTTRQQNKINESN